MIRIACPRCQRLIRVKEELAGKRGACPHCKQGPIVPNAEPHATIAPGPSEQRRPGVPAETLLKEAAGTPTVDYVPERLDFLAPAQAPGEIGRLGTYRIVKLLGAGGMGVVLHAEDTAYLSSPFTTHREAARGRYNAEERPDWEDQRCRFLS